MKTKNYMIILFFLFVYPISTAQVVLDTISLDNKNATESSEEIRYYYFPNLQAYFDTQRALYFYMQNKNWVTSVKIATNLRGYCVRNDFYVRIKGYIGDEPYTLFDKHKQKYPPDYSSKRKPKGNATAN